MDFLLYHNQCLSNVNYERIRLLVRTTLEMVESGHRNRIWPIQYHGSRCHTILSNAGTFRCSHVWLLPVRRGMMQIGAMSRRFLSFGSDDMGQK